MGHLTYDIENGTTPRIVFALVDATDNETGETVAGGIVVGDVDLYISKNGGAFADLGVTPTETGRGWYYITLTASHTDTDGPLIIEAEHNGTNIWRDKYTVGTAAATPASLSETEREALAAVMWVYSAADAYDSTYGQTEITDGADANKLRLLWLAALLGGIVAPNGSDIDAKLRSGDSVLATRYIGATVEDPPSPTTLS